MVFSSNLFLRDAVSPAIVSDGAVGGVPRAPVGIIVCDKGVHAVFRVVSVDDCMAKTVY